MTRSSLFVIAVATLFAIDILRHARNKRTAERHTFAWLAICAVAIGLALWREAIDSFATAIGVYYPPAALFFGACSGLLWLVYRQSLQLSELRRQIARLAQEIALQSAQGSPPPPGQEPRS